MRGGVKSEFIDEDTETAFLELLRKNGNITQSARQLGLSRQKFRVHKEVNPDFSDAWDAALAEAVDLLEAEAHRRAVEGFLEPVFYRGKECGAVRKYSDTMLSILLRGNNPKKFKEQKDGTMDVKGSIQVVSGIEGGMNGGTKGGDDDEA